VNGIFLFMTLLAFAPEAGGDASLGSPSARLMAPPVAEASARAYEWRPVAIGGGGFVTGSSTDRGGRSRVVRTDVYGAYLWREDKSRWVQLVSAATMPEADRRPMVLNQGVYEVAVAPSDASRIYMATAGAVYRSRDRGAHFVKTALPKVTFDANSPFRHYGPFIAIDPRNPDQLLFGTPADGLWRSTDAGDSWVRVDSVPLAGDLRPASGVQTAGVVIWFTPDGRQVWAMSPGHGVYRSRDGGASFVPLVGTGQPQPRTLRQGAFGPGGVFYGVDREDKKLWRFADGGWSDLTGQPGLSPSAFASVAIDPLDGQVYVFDEGGRAFISADGRTWSRRRSSAKVGAGEPPWLRVANTGFFATGQVVFDPVVPHRLWNAAGTGVYHADATAVGRVAWTSQVRGIEELVANDVVAPPGRLPLFAAWDFGVHLRDDLMRFSTGYGPKERVLIAVQQVDWSASNPSFLVTNASDTMTTCCSQDGDSVLAGYSTDGGRSWSKFPTLPQPPGTSANDPWRMAFGTIAVSAKDVDNIVWEPTHNRSPFYTLDRGVSWRRVVLPGERLPNTGSHADYYFHRRTLASDRVLASTFYLAHSGDGDNPGLAGLWVTRDGGVTWRRAHEGEIAPESRASAKLRAVPGKAGHLFFTSNNDGAADSRLRRSVDGGRSWMVLDGVERVHDVAFGKNGPRAAYPAIYIAGQVGGIYGIWRSIDDASSWTQVGQFPVGALDEVVVMDADKDVFGRVYLGFKGSGWRFGQPSDCAPSPYRFDEAKECFAAKPKR